MSDQDIETLLQSITNEDGEQKYQSLETALNGLKHSQEYIRTLEQEAASLRAKAEGAATLEELMAKLNPTRQESPADETPPEDQPADDHSATVAELVRQQLRLQAEEDKQAANLRNVRDALASTFADKAKDVYEGMAQDLGLTTADLDSLAKRSPNAVLKYFEKEDRKVTPIENFRRTTGDPSPEPIPEHIPVMLPGAKTSDVLAEWRRAGKLINS